MSQRPFWYTFIMVAFCFLLNSQVSALDSQPATGAAAASSQPASRPLPSPHKNIDAAHYSMAIADIDTGVQWLLKDQNEDGGWGKKSHPAFTAMVLKVLVQQAKRTMDKPIGKDSEALAPALKMIGSIERGYKFLLSCQQPDGGIYDPKFGAANYTTSLAVMALAIWDVKTQHDLKYFVGQAEAESPAAHAYALQPLFKDETDKAVAYLKGLQIKEGDKTPAGETITPASLLWRCQLRRPRPARPQQHQLHHRGVARRGRGRER